MKKFSVDYFIKKFSKIQRYRWICGNYQTKKKHKRVMKACAMGFCGEDLESTPESRALDNLFGAHIHVSPESVNDAYDGKQLGNVYFAKGKHPRTRILNALKDIKKVLDNKDQQD